MKDGLLDPRRECGACWERLCHYVYGYAWYRTEQRYWDLSDESTAIRLWLANRK